MFRKLRRYKQIEIRCPSCGHAQEEPASVISSSCRACGEYFRVRKGVAFPSPALRVSGISEVVTPELVATKRRGATRAPEEEPPGESWLADAEDATARPLPRREGTSDSVSGISAGAFFGLSTDGEEPASVPNPLGGRAQPRESLAEGSMGALIGERVPAELPEKDRMPPNYVPPEKRRKLVDASNDFPVRCFRCYHVQDVSKFAKSTQCERCSVYISLANYEVTKQKRHTLRTRGDIIIGRKGGLRDCEVACHHLTVNGSFDAYADCSGDAVFRRSARVRGHVHCRKLIVEKNAVVEFPDGVRAERADIMGRVVGNVICSGTVRVGRSGSVEGDIMAVEIEVREGATISGEQTIDPETSTALPVKAGFNPSVIG